MVSTLVFVLVTQAKVEWKFDGGTRNEWVTEVAKFLDLGVAIQAGPPVAPIKRTADSQVLLRKEVLLSLAEMVPERARAIRLNPEDKESQEVAKAFFPVTFPVYWKRANRLGMEPPDEIPELRKGWADPTVATPLELGKAIVTKGSSITITSKAPFQLRDLATHYGVKLVHWQYSECVVSVAGTFPNQDALWNAVTAAIGAEWEPKEREIVFDPQSMKRFWKASAATAPKLTESDRIYWQIAETVADTLPDFRLREAWVRNNLISIVEIPETDPLQALFERLFALKRPKENDPDDPFATPPRESIDRFALLLWANGSIAPVYYTKSFPTGAVPF